MKKLFTLLLMLFFCNAVQAAELFATVESLSGSATVADPSEQPAGISVGQKIYAKQTVSTATDGEVHLATVDGGIVAIRQNTVFRVDEYRADGSADDRIFMSLVRGAIRSITGWIGKYNAPSYRIVTPTATIGIRGTDHETTVIEEAYGDEPGTYDMVNEGVTVLKTQYGESEITAEKFAFAPKHRAIAPLILAQKPAFWAKRKLKIEERIEKRKEFLRERIEQIREERIRRVKEIHGERRTQIREKAAAKKDERAKARADQKKKTEQRREAKRKEAAQGNAREKPERPPRDPMRLPERKDEN